MAKEKHGWFDGPDKHGWFDHEKCPDCGVHWRLCTCGREKSDMEKMLEIPSRADIITHVAAMTGVPRGYLVILCAICAALMVVVLGGD